MSSQLIELNSLEKNDLEVWVNPGSGSDFDYSDGSNEEQYLIDLFKSTQDLSLDSPELAEAIQDWASLYHLSSSRANLLKNINLPENSTILELGCGCGAITRYLAEQGHKVTAVEGSLKRAEIARLRNREMNNVKVVCHNFNSLDLAPEHYDVILFIGVLEYAKRFSGQDDITAEQAVIQLLNQAKAALQPDGLMVIAIENRTGLKYELGALEDHFAIANVGIDNYQGYEFVGIKTYDYSQWQNILTESGLSNQFYYPFPDYKLPDLIICGDMVEQDAKFLSTQIQSTDPISDWRMPESEQEKWAAVIRNNELAEKANSFGIIATKEAIDTDLLFKNEWCLYDKDKIKSDYRLDLSKNRVENPIINKEIERLFNKPSEVKKSLLNVWLEEFSLKPGQQILIDLTASFIENFKHQQPTNKLFDLDQIMLVADKPSTLSSAKYWQLDLNVALEQQLFNLLLDFCITQRKYLTKASDLHLLNIEQIITVSFNSQDLNLTDIRSTLVEFLQNFNNLTQISPDNVEQDLATIISGFNQYDFNYVNSELFFTSAPSLFSQNNCRRVVNKQTGSMTTLYFRELPGESRHLRFDPCDQLHGNGHYFSIINFSIFSDENHGLRKLELDFHRQTSNLELVDQAKNVFKVAGIDPQIVFSLPEDLKIMTPSYNLAIQIQWLGK